MPSAPTAAMVLGLRKKGIDAEVLLLSHLPTKYAFIYRENDIPHHDVETRLAGGLRRSTGSTRSSCVDTGTWSQLPGLKERIADWEVPKLVIDHHLTQEDWADVKLVVTEAAAAAEIVGRVARRVGRHDRQARSRRRFTSASSATPAGSSSPTPARTRMRLAARLMEAGVDTDRLYQLLYQNERAERVALQTRALQSLELLQDGRLAVMRMPQADFDETGANVPDTENLINVPLQIAHASRSRSSSPSPWTAARCASASAARARSTSPSSPNNSAAAATPGPRA